MSIKSQIKAALRPYRRPLFEALGSDRYSHLALNDLDRKLAKYLDWRNGTFVEAGANDGLTQSNSYWFEKFRGWRGILVEAVPHVAAECRRNRPLAKVFSNALVGSDETKTIKIAAGGLRGYVTGNFSDADHEQYHRKVAAADLGQAALEDIDVPARTLAGILEEADIGPIDLLSLDVEGYELEVFKGMNVERHRPRFLCVESVDPAPYLSALNGHYELVERISEIDHLFRAID
jgi:FkbM family methyltransferase